MNAALTMLTGVSLSFCVKDLCEGKVQFAQVLQIIAATRFATDQDFEDGIASYKRNYWKHYPEQAEQFARALWTAGKIVQPRLLHKEHPGFNRDFDALGALNGAPSQNWFVGPVDLAAAAPSAFEYS